MATYPQIITKINGITDNGNNTAAEVRSVLTDILDFSNKLEPFEIGSPDLIVDAEKTYHYSFRGLKNNICNMYFLFNLTNKSDTTDQNGLTPLTIEISKEDFETLSSFIPVWIYEKENMVRSTYLAFTAPTLPVGMIRYINLVLYKIMDKFYILLSTSATVGETITTSLAINFKEFKMPGVSGRTNRTAKTANAFSNESAFNINPDLFK